MQPWRTLARARTPDGTELTLARRGDEFAIRAGGAPLMSSREHGSEEVMSIIAARRAGGPGSTWLIGGLGLGYTLRAALERLPDDAKVVVAELLPAVVEWNRGPLAHLAQAPLEDGRVEVYVGDVRRAMAARQGAFDAILLDVDNGPSALTDEGNHPLYGPRGLRTVGAVAHRHTVVRALRTASSRGDTLDGSLVSSLVRALHPTPAVAGWPVENACATLAALEGFDRGLYGGVVGVVGPRRTALSVALRGALVTDEGLLVTVGAGVVPGSTVDGEDAETRLKLDAVLSSRGLQRGAA